MHYRAHIDGLRAFSVAGVVAYHGHFVWNDLRLFPGGYLGVDVFLVISGFLITKLLLAESGLNTLSIRHFYIRRIRRIVPALYLVLCSSTIGALLILPPDAMMDFGEAGLSALFFVANIYFFLSSSYFAEAAEFSPLLHLWSLSVEEQFYVIYPIALTLAIARWRSPLLFGLLMVGAISLAGAAVVRPVNSEAVFYLVVFRTWELLAGAAMALRQPDNENVDVRQGEGFLTGLGFGLILLSFVLAPASAQAGLKFAPLAVSGACLVVSFGGGASAANMLLSARPVVGLGLISYSFYLWHQPLLAFARHYSINDLSVALRLTLIAAAMVLSVLSWRFVEVPFRRRGTFSDASVMKMWIGASLLLACLFAGVIYTHGVPMRYSVNQLHMLSVSAERGTSVLLRQDCKTKSLDRVCRIGANGVQPTWALLGDSHAETLADGVSDFLKKHGLAAEVLTYPGCPFVLDLVPVHTTEPCADFAGAVLQRLTSTATKTVIINDRFTAYMLGTPFDNEEGGLESVPPFPVKVKDSSGLDHERQEGVRKALIRTIETLLEHKIRVVYIAPIPEVGWHVPRTVTKLMARGGTQLTTSLEVYTRRHRPTHDILRAFAGRPNFVAIYPDEVLCNRSDGRCVTHSQQEVFYTDTDHLSRDGAKLLVDWLEKQLEARHFFEH